MKTQLSSVLGVAVITALMSAAVSTRADLYMFHVDSSQSSLTLSGDAFGLAFGGQGGNPNAMMASWSGGIGVDLTGGVLTFTGGSSITASLNPLAPFSTSPFQFPTPGVDAYGPYANGFIPTYGLAVINGVYRSLTLDITAGTATHGAAPSGVTLQFDAGWLDYGALLNGSPFPPVGGGTSSMVGVGGPNTSSSLVSFDGTTLYLPIQLHTTGDNRNEYWNGTIVAVIPEPTSLVLTGLGLFGLVILRSRGTRRGF